MRRAFVLVLLGTLLGSTSASCQSAGGGGGDADTDVDLDCDLQPTATGCPCNAPEPVVCYSGPDGTNGVGICHGGATFCRDRRWGPCEGEQLPGMEMAPLNGIDDDCDGLTDDGLCAPALACAGSCCLDTQDCIDGVCAAGGDSDTDTDTDIDCEEEGDPARPCPYYYYYGDYECDNAAYRVCTRPEGGGSATCYPADVCGDCCAGACISSGCEYYYY